MESHNTNFCIKNLVKFNFRDNFSYEEIMSCKKTKILKTYDIIKMG